MRQRFFCHIRPLLQPAFPFLVSSPVDHTFASFAEPNAMLWGIWQTPTAVLRANRQRLCPCPRSKRLSNCQFSNGLKIETAAVQLAPFTGVQKTVRQ
jgi:hypothetical protein